MALLSLLVCSLLHSSRAQPVSGVNDQTDITQRLNGYIAANPGSVYGGGKGVIFRNLNDGLDGYTVVPTSFISNDIFAANIVYPHGDPMCPTLGWDGYNKGNPCDSDPYLNAVVGVVVGSRMSYLFKDFDHIQDKDWGWGVFYGTDSNSADHRCYYKPDDKGWECPGLWVGEDGKTKPITNDKGAGAYNQGNPMHGGGGGGAGCHWSVQQKRIDQTQSDDGTGLVGNPYCECNYALQNNGWQDWVYQWMNHGKAKPGVHGEGWFKANGGGTAPNWAVDVGACWVNNIRDMIAIQNMVWFRRWEWNNQLMPQSYWNTQISATQRYYWGWNEVPIQASNVDNPDNWDCLVIKLPVAACGSNGGNDSPECMQVASKQDLDYQLGWHESKGFLKPGLSNIGGRPGSYIVFLREWEQATNYWQRWFFCENYDGQQYSVKFSPQNGKFPGQCYIDRGNGKTPAPPVCNGKRGAFIVNRDKNLCMDIAGGKLFNGVALQIWGCNGMDQQHFIWCDDNRIVSAVDDTYCVDIPGGVPGYPTNLQLWQCNGRESQKWGYDSKTLDIYPMEEGEKMCMDINGGVLKQGTMINLYPCDPSKGSMGEGWALVSPPPLVCWGHDGHFKPLRDQSKCLDLKGGQLQNGNEVWIWDCNGHTNQDWIWCSDNRIVSAMNQNFCLDIPGDTTKGTYLQIWECNGHENQRWGYDGNTLGVYPTSRGESMCMDLDSGSLNAGTRVNLYACDPSKGNFGEGWVIGKGAGGGPNATAEWSYDNVMV